MLPSRSLRHVLPTLPRVALRGPWYRAVNYDHLTAPPPGSPVGAVVRPLWPGGAARRGARFTPRGTTGGSPGLPSGIDCLYLAEDELTPLLEIAGVLRPRGSIVPLLFEPQVMMTVDGILADVIDLTDTGTQRAIGATHQELTGHWQIQQANYLAGHGALPPTQALGYDAFRSGDIVGLRYPSSKNPGGMALAVFTARLVGGRDQLRVFNRASGALQQSLP